MLVHHFCAREPPFGPYEVMVFVLLLPSKEMTLLGDCTYLFHCHIARPTKKRKTFIWEEINLAALLRCPQESKTICQPNPPDTIFAQA